MTAESKRKIKSTTFWLSVTSVILNPIAWWYDHYRRIEMLDYMIENDIEPDKLSFIFTELPLTTLATATLTIVTAYVGGNKGRNIADNLKQKGQPHG